MKLPERLARRKGRGFHSAFATSFAVEFAAFEEVMLPQLSAGGATNVVLIADGRMATMALSDGSALPEALGREYVLHSPPVADGVFHPKVILQVGREGGRCLVSSANITGAGLGGNVEVAVEIECGNEPSAQREIVQAAWRYVEALVPGDAGAAREAVTWARDRARWLDETGSAERLHELKDGTALAFLARPGGSEGIGAAFADLVGDEAVERLVVVSPYWDNRLEAVTLLEQALRSKVTSILLDVDRHEFPTGAPMPAHRSILDISGWQASRFKHAKVVVAVTAEHDHVLSGSANCTVAALGGERFAGVNAEACVYRRLPRGTATAALGMDDWLAADPFPASDLPAPVETIPIPLEQMHAGGTGAFEAEGGRLHWRRPPGRWPAGLVTLTDSSGVVVSEIEVAGFAVEGDRLTTWVGETLSAAAFAYVTSGELSSLRGYVVHRSALRARRRESAGGSVAKALAAFDDAAEMQIRMLQAFDELARADAEDRSDDDVPARVGAGATPKAQEGASEARFLTYEEFMVARSSGKGRGGRSDSSVAGTHFDSVRALLNRLSGVEGRGGGQNDRKDDDSWMDLGDETGELGDAAQPREAEEPSQPRVRSAPDMALYDRMVKTYVDRLASEDRAIGPRDVLRLRLWIVTILWEARCAAAPKGMPAVADEKGWPRLVVRIVSAFFWGRNSPIGRLVVSTDYDEMPVDFFECWTTVLWALDAVVALVPQQPRTRDFLRRLPLLRAQVVLAVGLTPDETRGEPMIAQRAGLDAELGARLGISPAVAAA